MKKIIILLTILIIPKLSFALAIDFNVGSFSGKYSVMGYTPSMVGNQTVELNPGTYHILVGTISSFQIDIDEAGEVTVRNQVSAEGGLQSLHFNTVPINVNASLYKGIWYIPAVTGNTIGSKSDILLVPGLKYFTQVAAIDGFIFSVNAQGEVVLETKKSAAQAEGSNIQFNTRSLDIDPDSYLGQWYLTTINKPQQGSLSGVHLLPGMDYQIVVGAVGSFKISVKEDGDCFIPNNLSASYENNKVKFKTFPMDIHPGTYAGTWSIASVTSLVSGHDSSTHLVPGVNFRLTLSNGKYSHFIPTCEENGIQLNLGSDTVVVSCFKEEAPLLCEQAVDTSKKVKCSGNFIAKNLDDLNDYLKNNGFYKGQYKHLKLQSNFEQERLSIVSPCAVKIMPKTKIIAKELCINGMKAVKIHNKSVIKAQKINIRSEKGKVKIHKKAKLEAYEVEMLQASRN